MCSMKLPDAGRIRARYAATVKELTVNYGDNYVLNHGALYVESGKRTFLTGTNGAGKSTLIKAILQHEPEPSSPLKPGSLIFPGPGHPGPQKTVKLENVTADGSAPSISAGLCYPTFT